MAEFAAKNLGNGVVPTSKTVVYTVPAGHSAITRSISLVNVSAGAVTINVYANFGTGSRQISPRNLSLAAGALFELDVSVTLESGDALEMDASSAVIDYVVSGVETV